MYWINKWSLPNTALALSFFQLEIVLIEYYKSSSHFRTKEGQRRNTLENILGSYKRRTWNNIWTNPHIVGIYLWHQSSSSILRFCILPHQTSSSRLFWSFLGVRNSWGQTLLSFTHCGAPSLASLIWAGASQSRCHSHSHRHVSRKKKGILRERLFVALDWKNWTRSDSIVKWKCFGCFLPRPGWPLLLLSMLVASTWILASIPVIFLYYLFIILILIRILPSIYIIFIIAFPSLCFEVIVILMYVMLWLFLL